MQSLFIIRPKNTRSKQQHSNYLVMSTVYIIDKYNLYFEIYVTSCESHEGLCQIKGLEKEQLQKFLLTVQRLAMETVQCSSHNISKNGRSAIYSLHLVHYLQKLVQKNSYN